MTKMLWVLTRILDSEFSFLLWKIIDYIFFLRKRDPAYGNLAQSERGMGKSNTLTKIF